MKEQRFLKALGEVDDQYIKEAEPMKTTTKKSTRKIWASIAACLVLIAAIGVFKSGLFEARTDIATLENGEKITFVESDTLASQVDLDVTIRVLTDEELKLLSADLPITANAYFDPDSHNMIGFEGTIGDVKLIVSKSGVKLLDRVIEGNKYTSTIDAVPVAAGYFITESNKTVIYYAYFDIGETSVYVEYSGAKDDSENVKNKLATTIQQLIENGEFDLSQIRA